MQQPIEALNKVQIKESGNAKQVQSTIRALFPGIGETPAEYNVKVHGPYNPGTFYGKRLLNFKLFYVPNVSFTADPIGEVKVGELGSWIARRNFHPTAIVRACSSGKLIKL